MSNEQDLVGKVIKDIDGREYHFLNKMNFLTKINCGSFAEYRIYETERTDCFSFGNTRDGV